MLHVIELCLKGWHTWDCGIYNLTLFCSEHEIYVNAHHKESSCLVATQQQYNPINQ